MNNGKYQDVLESMKEHLTQDDCLHTYRVLNYALQILETEAEANPEVVILSAILHDIGRAKRGGGEMADKSHAEIGAEKSRALLAEKNYPEETIRLVSECILSHSRSAESEPQTLEAKILFDADKLDMTGAVGATRAIQAAAADGKPLYHLDDEGFPLNGKKKEPPSLFQDYQQKLEKITVLFYTEKACKMAIKRQKAMDDFFGTLHKEANKNHENGMKLLHKYCK